MAVVQLAEEDGTLVEVVAGVKQKIISLWLHLWLKRIAKKYPDFFIKMMEDVCDDNKSKEIMKLRYIERLKFKAIPVYVSLEERAVYSRHQEVIYRLINI